MRHFDPQDYCHETLDRCKSGHTLVLFDSRKLTDPRNSHVVVLFPISHLSTCHVKATWSEKLRLIIHTEGKTFCCSFYRIPDQPTVAWPMWVGAVRLSVMGTTSFVSPSVHRFHSLIFLFSGQFIRPLMIHNSFKCISSTFCVGVDLTCSPLKTKTEYIEISRKGME